MAAVIFSLSFGELGAYRSLKVLWTALGLRAFDGTSSDVAVAPPV
jgi:hypothetical protein